MASLPPPWRQPFPCRASSAPDKRRRGHDDHVKQELIHRITAKLPADWHCDRNTLLETCEPPHLGFLNENIKKDTPISICTFGIKNFERLGRGETIVERDIQRRFRGNSYKYDVLKSQTATMRAADNARQVIRSLEQNHPEICGQKGFSIFCIIFCKTPLNYGFSLRFRSQTAPNTLWMVPVVS